MVFIGYEFNNSGVDMKKTTTLNVMAIILYMHVQLSLNVENATVNKNTRSVYHSHTIILKVSE